MKGARILVTGGTGFLGSRVSVLLEETGAQVTRIGRSQFDLRYEGDTLTAVLAAQPDIIVHLAAVSGGIGARSGARATLFRDNMLIDMNVVHAAAVARAKLIAIGTPSSYPEGKGPLKESSFWEGFPEGPDASFGVAKRALHTLCQSYRIQFGLRYGYLVPTNLYGVGGKDQGDAGHVIPSLVRRFVRAREEKAKEVACWGTGKAIRSFLHVDDAAMAVAVACEKLDSDDIVNLPGGPEIQIEKLAAMIAELVGYQGAVKWDELKPEGRPQLVLDGSRALKLLGWKPMIPFKDGLRDTVQEIAAFLEKSRRPEK